MNHFAVGCMKNKKIRVLKVENYVVENSEYQYFSKHIKNSVYNIKNSEKNKKWKQIIILIKFNNFDVEVIIDTRVEVSILPYGLYDKFNLKPVIEKSGIKIETFGAFFIKPIGMIFIK